MRKNTARLPSIALLPLLALMAPACATSSPDDDGTGGLAGGGHAGATAIGAAGTHGTGGSGAGGSSTTGSAGTGGSSATGSAGSGGSSATGGIGAAGTGGSSATGNAGSGGSSGTGTAGRGGTSGAGGMGGKGGSSATGGAGAGGSSGTGTAGKGGASGAGGMGGKGGSSATGGAGAGGSSGTGTAGKGGAGGAGGKGGSSATGGAGAGGGSAGSGAGGSGGGGILWNAGNPNGSCSAGVPAKGQAADTSNPTTVVGTGTAASCTFGQLQTAVTQGGVITFNCGSGAVTIAVTATMNLPINKNTVIDGGRKITLDGGNAVQILSFNSPNYKANDNGLTLQHIALINGKKTPTQAIPTAPAPCSQGWDDGQGGALYMRDGNLKVVDSIFTNNHAAPLGPDTGGGAIYVLGSKNGAWIVGSTFSNNAASNAGGVGGLQSELDIYNSLFTNNTASGHDANNNEPSKCSAINNDQNETGSGGNGAAIYSDGESVNVALCGDAVLNNAAGVNAFGGGLFFTSNDFGGTLSIADTTMTGNTGGHWTSVNSGSVTNVGTAVGVNAKSITVTNSVLQGAP